MSWTEAMDTMGTDRPDLRFGLRFVDVTDVFADTNYSIFRQIMHRGGCIKGMNIKGQSEKLSKNVLQNEYAKEIAPSFGAKGMTWMRAVNGELESNIVQYFSTQELEELKKRFAVTDGDVLIMVADPSYEVVVSALGQLRLHIADRLGLIPKDRYCPVWITDFPLFEATDDGEITSSHHPFTAPDRTDFDPHNIEDLLALRSRAYDLVLNGEELGGGSIRISDREVQRKIFTALGLSEEETKEKFGFFLRAFEFGPPPHGGLALGMDRTVSMIAGSSSIREVMAFPKNRSAACPLTGAPSAVQAAQLAELDLFDLAAKEVLPGAAEKENDIDRISWVSRIGISEQERPMMQDILTRAESMAQTAEEKAGFETPIRSVAPATNRTRPGIEAKPSPLAESGRLLENAPAVKGNYFKVASILE
jgi:aspartyl-tRNA synthetase